MDTDTKLTLGLVAVAAAMTLWALHYAGLL